MAPAILDCAHSLGACGTAIWCPPISDHMKSSKQDVTSDIIAYYV
ncbi:unnamed protein product [Staurois parvus]|uniref:Uncharacterized protein n=1 Tax=Staurois parvus TaxID=386267 RepID=A0ABN9G7Z1_9NEOB|nr:unnamed protein product [Staurois parvus]